MQTTVIKHSIILPGTPVQVYELLTDSILHSEFTGAEAEIGLRVGDAYSAYDGYITGENIELIPGKKIVQTWIAHEDNWPEGHVSRITFIMEPASEGSTQLHFIHEEVPAGMEKTFSDGWQQYYWDPMQAYLE